MQYLLIDFGASFIKLASYSTGGRVTPLEKVTSPFCKQNTITKSELYQTLKDLLCQHPEFTKVVCCSILGGGWLDGKYYSWKSNAEWDHLETWYCPLCYDDSSCLISGLFKDSPSFHVHSHHGGDIEGLEPLGEIEGIVFYSSLGDTDCVIKSLDIKKDEYVVNIGTGSQVISLDGDDLKIEKYIPAGRTFLAYQKFFSELGTDFFEELSKLSTKEIMSSTIDFDLNIFKQSVGYVAGGSITNIKEDTLTKSNFFGSILKNFVNQYGDFFEDDNKSIRLTGGIPEKLPVLGELFSLIHNKEVTIDKVSNPFTGQVKYIEEYLQ